MKNYVIRHHVAHVLKSFVGKQHCATAKLQLHQCLMRCGEFSHDQIWTKESLYIGGLNWFQAFCYKNTVLREIALCVHFTPTMASTVKRN